MQAPTSEALAERFRRATGMAPRPHQVSAVTAVCRALASDCHKGAPSNYLCQHATGSGKTLTMAMLAHALTQMTDERGNRFALVVVVSDRRVLDQQNGETLAEYFGPLGCGGDIERVPSCARLREMLSEKLDAERRPRVAAATLQKAAARHWTAAAEVPATESTARVLADEADGGCRGPRVVLIADEAHRSHGHSTTEALHGLLCGSAARGQARHVAYVSFSATPTASMPSVE